MVQNILSDVGVANMDGDMKKRLIVVVGMHRSGTSAITRGLQVMGVGLGDKIMPGLEDNVKGFWEDLDFNALNIEMLSVLDSNWHHLAPIEPDDVNTLRKKGYFLRAVELLRTKVGNSPLFGFKDPRVAKLLPFWKEVFVHCQIDTSYLLATRHPLSVVKSLKKRDGFEAAKSYAMWLGHVITSLSCTVGENRIVVDYDRLMQSPDHEINRIATCFNLTIDAIELQTYKTEFLEQGLRHTVYELNDLLLDEVCPPLVNEIYTALMSVAADETRLDDPALQKKVENWAIEFERIKSILTLVDQFANRETSVDHAVLERDRQVAELKQVVAERDQSLQVLSAQVAECDQSVQTLSAQLAERNRSEREQSVQAISAQLAEIKRSKAWRTAMLIRRSRVLLAPPKSRRARVLRKLANAIRFPIKKLRSNRISAKAMALVRSSGLFHRDFSVRNILASNSEIAKAQAMFSVPTAKPRQRRCPSESLAPHSTVYAFTSICLNYLPKALVLAQTLKQYNPQVRFCLLVNEPIPAGLLDSYDIFDEVATIDDLDIPDKQAWIFGHSVVELSTAVKGYFMLDLLKRPECATAFYFDPDIAVFSSIEVLLNQLNDSSILLTPHQTEPEENIDAIKDNEICSLKHGVYNLGFLGVKSSAEGLRFARWWRDRLHHFCRADIPAGLFTDQRWIDLAPAFFTDLHILRHPGCNVSTWNLTHRRIEGNFSDGFTVNEQPLIFYHFSGFDSGAQEVMLTKYGKHMPAAWELREWYLSRTERPEDEAFSNRQWRYNYFTNGEPITSEQRRLFRDRADLQQTFPDPFTAAEPSASFYHWHQAEVLNGRHSERLHSGHDVDDQEQSILEQSEATLFLHHPSETSRSIIQWATANGPVILFVGHYGDGGTEKHLRELAGHIKDRARILLLSPKYDGSVLLTTLPSEKHAALCFDPIKQFEELAEFLEACKLDRIHIHHEFGNESYLERLVNRLGKPFDFTVHDYYALSPNPQLIGPDNRFIGEDLASNANRLLAMSMCSKRPANLANWQSDHRWLLTDAARVIAPSHDVANRLKANVPTLNPIVAAHPEKHTFHQSIHIEKIEAHSPLRIAVLGQLSEHKGCGVLLKCAQLAQKNDYPLSFDLIGQPNVDGDALAQAGVRISGPYDDLLLQTLIRSRRPHLIWYPALWPETYSYTLSAAFTAALPIVVPDIGAFPERVVGRRWSWVCSWDLAPNEWVDFFKHIREANFLAGVEPECPVGMPSNDDNFYEQEYLSWHAASSDKSILTKRNAAV
jgi:glycosyltransferase involved in cell wall biosynthesis